MTSVSDIGQNTLMQSIITSSQQQLDTVQAQISSGLKAQTYGGLGGLATYQSLSLTSQNNALTAANSGLNAVTNVTSAMDSAMTGITSSAQSVLTNLQSIIQGSADPGMDTLGQEAGNALSAIQHYLNTQSGTTYVFAASDSANPPIANSSSLTAAVQADMAAYQAGTETAATLTSNIAAYTPAQMGYSSTLAAAANVSVPTGNDNQTIDYTVKGDSSGFQSLMQGLSTIANLKYTSSDSSSFYTVYNAAVSQISSGITSVTASQAKLGAATSSMAAAQTQISTTQSVLTTAIGNVDDLSTSQTAAASTTLSNLETQLQASYSIISQLQSVHLIDFLDGTA